MTQKEEDTLYSTDENRLGGLLPQDRRTFMKAAGLLSLGVGGQMSLGTVKAQEDENFDVEETYVQLDSHVPGVLYEPTEETDRSHIIFVIMHSYSDYTTHDATRLAHVHGYRTLGTDPIASRVRTERGQFHLHNTLPDLDKAIRFACNIPEVDTIIHYSASAGPQLTALYQNIAENGLEVGQDDEKLLPLPDELEEEAEFLPADGMVLWDPTLGDAAKGLVDLGPQVVDPENPQKREPELDMLNPENGYNPNNPDEPSSYSDEFLERFYEGQAERMNGMIEENLETLQKIEDGDWRFPDDDQFILLDTRSRVFRPDPSILAHTQDEHELLHAEDSEVSDELVTEEQVDSIRDVREPDYEPPFTYIGDETEPQSVRRFLSTRAIRPTSVDDYRLTESTIEGINWNSSNAQVAGNLETVSIPLYMQSGTGHYFVVSAETSFNHAGSSDKTLHYIEGATHGRSPIEPEYGDTLKRHLDSIDEWTADRFL